MFGFLITSIYPPIIHRIEKESAERRERERLLDNKKILIDVLKCIHRRYACMHHSSAKLNQTYYGRFAMCSVCSKCSMHKCVHLLYIIDAFPLCWLNRKIYIFFVVSSFLSLCFCACAVPAEEA